MRFIQQGEVAGSSAGNAHTTVALGADHGGYALKRASSNIWNSSGNRCGFWGPRAGTFGLSDYAQAVAQNVALRKADFGRASFVLPVWA